MSDSHFVCSKLFWKDNDTFVHIISNKSFQRPKIHSQTEVPNFMV